jgi:acid stress-induced BolA-like protein IbaG/YrbA
MALHINRPAAETTEKIREAIEQALPGSTVEAQGMGGHFEIRVVSEAFVGKGTLAKHRLILSAIAHLMKGDAAPVHAVDKIEALAP